jgi:hypothetical protein
MVDRCCKCKMNGEFVDHLLLHCEVVETLWDVSSVDLGYLGLCLHEQSTYIRVGGFLVVLRVLLCRRWCLCVCCGVYGMKEMIEVLRTERSLEEIKSLFFYTLYLWTTVFVYLVVISYYDFLVLFLLLTWCFSCILLVYLGLPYAFNDVLITFKKNIFNGSFIIFLWLIV